MRGERRTNCKGAALRALGIVCSTAALSFAQEAPATGRQVFERVCGVCHTPQSVLTGGRQRAQWQETINKMVGLGAKASDEELAAILNYLSSEYGPDASPGGRRGGRGGGASMSAGPNDKHVVDPAAADRGRGIWAAECINCHGTYGRGTDNAPNLIRSDVVLHDRYGNTLGPFLKKGHPMQSGGSSARLTAVEVAELSHFLHQQVYNTLRGSPLYQMHDILTGDAKAGAAYFNGQGGCKSCHSPEGDLKGIGSRLDPPTLLARFLYPGAGNRGGRGGRGTPTPGAKHVTLTVTPPSGEAVTGTPIVFDDFDVSIRDASGAVHSWTRTPGLKIVKNNPFAAHEALLEKYTDKNMHDLLAYLVTLK